MNYLVFACHCVVGLLFGVSAVSKLHSRKAFDEFARTTRVLLGAVVPRYEVGRTGSRQVGMVIVAAEAAIPFLLVVRGGNRFGHGVGIVLLTAFSLGISAAMYRGVRTTCRCFGTSSTPLGTRHLVRNAVLVGAAVTGVVFGPVPPGETDPAGLAIACAAALILAILVVRLDDLIDLFAPTSALAGRPSR